MPHSAPRPFSHLLFALVFFLTIAVVPALAAVEDFDPTFGTGGKATGSFPGSTGKKIEDLVVQPDGKILAVGTVDYRPGSDFVLLRYNPDGSADASFGNQGVVLTDLSFYDQAHALLLQPDGKILVAGETAGLAQAGVSTSAPTDLALARYLPDGQLDPAFGEGGKVIVDLAGENDYGVGLARTPDGNIYVAAISGRPNETYLLARFHSNGSLDTSFGASGSMEFGTGEYDEAPFARVTPQVVAQADGKIIYSARANHLFTLARLLPTGSLDPGFGQNGAITLIQYLNNDLVLAPDGKIVAVGDYAIARFTHIGILDTSFDQDGILSRPFSEWNYVFGTKAAITSDNHLVAIEVIDSTYKVSTDINVVVTVYNLDGSIHRSFVYKSCKLIYPCSFDTSSTIIAAQPDAKLIVGTSFGIDRLNPDGQRDLTLDTHGWAEAITFPASSWIQSAALQSDGKIVVLRQTSLALSRYLPNGALDPSFGGDGSVSAVPNAAAMIIQPDQKILVAGTYKSTGFMPHQCIEMQRYLTDGNPDPDFPVCGGITLPPGCPDGVHFYAKAIALQPDGKIIIAGESEGGGGIWRFHSNGNLDADFMNTEPYPHPNFGSISRVALQPYGKIVLLTTRPEVVRLNTDGSLDTGFGAQGKITLDLSASPETPADLLVQPDGSLLVAVKTDAAAAADFTLARLLPDGSLDTTFDQDGIVTLDFYGGEDQLESIELQADQKIVLVGTAWQDGGDFALARLNPDGNLDDTFGDGGKLTTDFYNGDDTANDSMLQPDGKLVVAGRAQNGGLYEYALARYNLGPDTSLTLETGQTGTTPDSGVSLTLNSLGPCTFSVTRLPAPIFGHPLQFGALPFRWYLASTCERFDLDITFPYSVDDLAAGNAVVEDRLKLYQSQYGLSWLLTEGVLEPEANTITLHNATTNGYYSLLSPGEPNTWIYLPLIR